MRSAVALIVSLLALSSCAKKPATSGRHATVTMRDGTVYTGVITNNSGDQMTLTGDDNKTYTLVTANVRSVDYGEAAAPASSQPPPPYNPPPQSAPQYSAAPLPRPAASEIRTHTWTAPAGTEIAVRTDETIDSDRAAPGQTYAARITRDVRDARGDVIIPRGSDARIVIRSAERGGEFHGRADLVMGLESVSVAGHRYRLETSDVAERGRRGVGGNKRTAKFAGGGAAFGAIIGAIAGGGKGAAIGALSGGGAGAATEMMTKGHRIRVPAESALVFRLEAPLRVIR